jgi:4-amino-4-deoxy-L-arabinose transferase-like glycosyltransferase
MRDALKAVIPTAYKNKKWFVIIVLVAVALRAGVVIAAGPNRLTFLSGGSDAPAYALLASNLVHGQGYSYAGQPTAFRAPGYPLIVAAALLIFGTHYILALRCSQFFIGICTAYICGRTAKLVFKDFAADWAFVFALLLPTQVFASVQVLTECITSFWTSVFLYYLVRELLRPAKVAEIGMGFAAGLATLLRFNAAALPLFAITAVVTHSHRRRLWTPLVATLGIPFLIVMPWLVRNVIVFHGQVVFSTHGGYNAIQGVLSPQGRTQGSDSDKLFEAVGWRRGQLETNDPVRRNLGPEPILDRANRRAVVPLWRAQGWGVFSILGRKLLDFWLSTDQLLDTNSFSRPERLARLVGVISYWLVFALAIIGWRELHRVYPHIARTLLAYAVVLTILHLPLVMSTRIRIPLMDPLIVALAGGGWSRVWRGSATDPTGPLEIETDLTMAGVKA